MTKDTTQQKQVPLEDLGENMTIQAYTGFNEKYKHMDEKVCQWLQHNFKGSRAIVERQGEKLDTLVDRLETDDSLQRLFAFPATLKKLTVVNTKLVQELRKRGFLRFDVQRTIRSQSSKQERRQQAVERAGEFVDQVKESVVVREGATQAVENIMDNTRVGKTSTAEIMSYVDNMVDSSSAEAVSAISSLKQSDQTYAHCVDVGAIFQTVYQKLLKRRGGKSIFENEQQILFSSFMHDFGKAKVPKEILDSTVRFERDSYEMQMMQSHPEFGAEMLKGMGLPNHIVNMAQYHHVKLDTSMNSSYPKDARYEDVIPETRLIAIVDIYQALVGRRSYKKSWAPPAAMRFIEQLAGIEYDQDVFEDFLQIMGRYPVGSLVELNDESLAFVVNVSETDAERPRVVVVRNAEGEDLEHQILIDLQEERDAAIVKERDNTEVFGDAALDLFTNLTIS
ncbi:MAG: HD domain-containing protein [Proteobacteria bacterium]|nr:HD domain-containing protein [Pseudomonadota bacterium]